VLARRREKIRLFTQALAIEVADFAVGHKATLIALDYIVLTYLFIFDSWFRNAVVFNILMTIEKD